MRRATQLDESIAALGLTFQPTPSLRRATPTGPVSDVPGPISTHALLAEGDAPRRMLLCGCYLFQPTPSLRRATSASSEHAASCSLFQPTPSLRRATVSVDSLTVLDAIISTHALLAEGDVDIIMRRLETLYISTHALLAEGDGFMKYTASISSSSFQPTPSLRRATVALPVPVAIKVKFQPTPSLRRATRS